MEVVDSVEIVASYVTLLRLTMSASDLITPMGTIMAKRLHVMSFMWPRPELLPRRLALLGIYRSGDIRRGVSNFDVSSGDTRG